MAEKHHVVVDGSNLATEGRTSPSLRQLDEAVTTYAREHPDAQIVVVVDASFGHRIDPEERGEFEKAEREGKLVSPPAGAIGRGDAFVLRIAERTGATVLSNDSFQEFHAEHPWLFDEDRLVGGKPVPGVGWIFTRRTPVRGPRSRQVTGKAKREAERSTELPAPLKAAELARAAEKVEARRAAATPAAALGEVRKAPAAPPEKKAKKAKKAAAAPKMAEPAPVPAPKTAKKGQAKEKTAKKEVKAAGAGAAARAPAAARATKAAKAATPSQAAAAKATTAAKATKATTAVTATGVTRAKKAPATAATRAKARPEIAAVATGAPAAPARPSKKAARGVTAKKAAATAATVTGLLPANLGPEVVAAIHEATAEALSPAPPAGAREKAKAGGKGAKEGKAAKAGGKGAKRRRPSTPPPAVNEPLAFISFVAAYPMGSEVEGEVASFTSHGAMVEVGVPDGASLHCYIPLAGLGHPPPRKAREVLSRGQRRTFVLVSLDPPRRMAELALPGAVPRQLAGAQAGR